MRTQTTLSLGLALTALLLIGGGCGQKTKIESDLSTTAYKELVTASVNVANQTLVNSTVYVPKVILTTDGWVVVHADKDGVPSEIIGQTAVLTGEHTDVKVTVDAKKVTPIVHVMLHVDLNKKGIFEFPGDDVPVTVNNVGVSGSFQVTKSAGETDTKTSANTNAKITVEVKPELKTETKTEVKVDLKSAVKSFTLTAKNWEFSPSTISVKKGDTVKLTITSTDVEHGFALPEFNVNKKFKAGETVNVEFVADKSGSFPFTCSVFCGSGHKSMKGTLVVE
ncbi:MAG: hypothetical protein A2821_02530 [Candidatus Magasanikbacteria bacterium RIFCSPHIGHO2_01_FULL_41_23]|uniref:Cytochrome oxidase subunit II copper A binding domain-containing protein n=1 Tax=Candidatus Magasanikbacteria bacterium RIFCSPLOWO2_01_FULL_40_15 TaxID=1798686 RepID=A0A1F6N3A3_9BACT|nr:MAG: hypothetical protein A2821_02530 [Candidatus Magasanikbacteria bacterium RIFCSPHIGHO2_01_FULL_41_23]OGH66885.1 MAG: hypothetical protein A3C66_02310 [Candidatus Magasanikbacteria bacterium RIFCSPHIGHO2_02_FULL_41_35]OGH74869.1 MAG: hypothetical protein A3F22_04240 [Candidatus Magasanikbacteria bacterium RIFCSPHIGHO2_12_FULL_41_16]OGH78143.1 MAG: hypothetical protein A2983_03660 [Candidatus Magasanikbacteria bacterium RIFCSPLOWO2_01_FULL_40_15]